MYLCEGAETCDDTQLPRIFPVALFDFQEKKIFLAATFDARDPEQQGTLLHELVHYVQALSGKDKTVCRGLLEREAYRLEDQWRLEQGLNPLPITPARIAAESCIPGPT